MCFPVNFAKFLRTPFLTEDLRWLLLNIILDYLKKTVHNLLTIATHIQGCERSPLKPQTKSLKNTKEKVNYLVKLQGIIYT